MKPEKIISVVALYEARLQDENIPKTRMSPKRTFASLEKTEMHDSCALFV